jgi:hypothetical protein
MPRAEKLNEAYNNLYVEPLKEEQEFQEFYVERPATSSSPMEELKDRIEISCRKEKYLFLGFRGSGKSTELNRLEAALDKSRFMIVNYSIREDLNVSDFDFRDFFVSMALKIYDIAQAEGVPLNSDIETDFLDFTKRITSITEDEITRQRSAGLSLSRILTLKISREAKTRECLRKELDQKISELIQRLNWLIVDIESKADKQVVVLVDDLDKLARGQQSEDFFYKNYALLLQPDCFVVYTFPIPLAFHPNYETVRQAFNADMILLQLPVKDRNGSNNEENMGFYRQVVTKRMNPELIEEGILDEAISSTGKLSEFAEIMRESSLKAFRMNRKRISKDDVEVSLDKLRATYDRTLTEAHKKKLLDIHECQEARDEGPDSQIIRELLFSLTAVLYKDNEGRWCEIDPLLLPLVEKWSKSR